MPTRVLTALIPVETYLSSLHEQQIADLTETPFTRSDDGRRYQLLAAVHTCARCTRAVRCNIELGLALPAVIVSRPVFESGTRALWGSFIEGGWARLSRSDLAEQRKIVDRVNRSPDIEPDDARTAVLDAQEAELGGATRQAPNMYQILNEVLNWESARTGAPTDTELSYAMLYSLASQYVHGSARQVLQARPAELAIESVGLCLLGARRLLDALDDAEHGLPFEALFDALVELQDEVHAER